MPQPKLDPADETARRALRLPSRLNDQLEHRAKIENRTASDVLRDALVAHLERKASPAA